MQTRLAARLAGYRPGQLLNYWQYWRNAGRSASVNYQPLVLSFVVNNECNLGCAMCFTHGPHRELNPQRQNATRRLPPELMALVLRSYPRARRVELIGAGEPLLHPEWETLVRMAVAAGKRTTLVTNGTVLDGEKAERLVCSGLHNLAISINAATAEEYRQLTGMPEATHTIIVRNAGHLAEVCRKSRCALRLCATFVINRLNYARVPEMLSLCRRLGIKRAGLLNQMSTEPGGGNGLRATDSEALIFCRNAARMFPDIQTGQPLPLPAGRQTASITCDCYFRQLRIDGDGRVGSCSMLCLALPEDRWHDDGDMFNSRHFIEMRRTLIAGDRKAMPALCNNCPCL